MDHHGVVDPVEHPGVEHLDFAAPAFFRGGAEEDAVGGQIALARQLVEHDGRPNAGGCDQVVSARMAVRQGVEFRDEPYVQSVAPRLVLRADGRLQLSGSADCRKAMCLYGVFQKLRGLEFLKRQFRIFKNSVAD